MGRPRGKAAVSAREAAASTRINLVRTRRRLERVGKGIALLRRKREALVVEFFHLARPAADARMVIVERCARAYPALLRALAVNGQPVLQALGWPGREPLVEIRAGQVWGISVSDIATRPPLSRTLEARGTTPAGAGPAAVEAAEEFEGLADLLLDAAPREMLIRRLGEALARTTRQVNTLERRVSPGLQFRANIIRRGLEEREREERVRLRFLSRKRAQRAAGIEGIVATSGRARE